MAEQKQFNILRFGNLSVNEETVNKKSLKPYDKMQFLSISTLTQIFNYVEKKKGMKNGSINSKTFFGVDKLNNDKTAILMEKISLLLDKKNDEYKNLYDVVFNRQIKIDDKPYYLNIDNNVFTTKVGKKIVEQLKKTNFSLPISDDLINIIVNEFIREYKNLIDNEIVPAFRIIKQGKQFSSIQFSNNSTKTISFN